MAKKTKTVYLIDGTFELFRAYYGGPSLTDKKGHEVGATRTLLRSLISLIRNFKAIHIAVAFDHVIESFRNQLFSGYKTGAGIERELLSQFPLAEDGVAALGVTSWPMVEFEADDALATAAAKFSANNAVTRVVLCSPDKDLCQCVKAKRVVTWDRIRDTYRDEAGVKEKFGVGPRSIPDWLALVGDSADGIPGIARWGAKAASTILDRFGHVDRIPQDVTKWPKLRGAQTLHENLERGKQDVLLYRELATLRTDVPLDCRLSAVTWKGPDNELTKFATRIGDSSLVETAEQALNGI